MSIINTANLSKSYKIYTKKPGIKESIKALFKRESQEKLAVESVSLCVNDGELLGIVGPNGAGKTTLLKMLCGLLYPSSGEIKVLDNIPYKLNKDFLRSIGFISGQRSQLTWDLPAMDSYELLAILYDVKVSDMKVRVEHMANMLGVSKLLNVPQRNLSLGERMKCELIGTLIHSPKLLLLDEPTLGLDVVSQRSLRVFIKEYNKISNATILITSHYMKDIKEICDRLVIINHGRLLYDGSVEDVGAKLSDYINLSVILEKPVCDTTLTSSKYFLTSSGHTIKFKLPRKEVSNVCSEIMLKYPVLDTTIEELDIEDIIADIFTEKNS